MASRNSVQEKLKRIVGNSNILTTPEDLFVYSFERFFETKSYPNLAAVVWVAAEEQLKRVKENAEAEGIKVALRSAWKKKPNRQEEAVTVLIDDTNQPELAVVSIDER